MGNRIVVPVPDPGVSVCGTTRHTFAPRLATYASIIPEKNAEIYRQGIDANAYMRLLWDLGYDVTRNRRHGYQVLIPTLNEQGGYHFDMTWRTFDSGLIRDGETFTTRRGGTPREIHRTDYWLKPENLRTWLMQSYSPIRRVHKSMPSTFPHEIRTTAWIMDRKIHGLSQHTHTNILMFDIDNHTDTPESRARVHNTIIALVRILGAQPLFTEFSLINGSCHIAFRANRQVHDSFAKGFVSWFHRTHPELGILEPRLTTRVLRIPCSLPYLAGNCTVNGDTLTFVPYTRETQVRETCSGVFSRYNESSRVFDLLKIQVAVEFSCRKKPAQSKSTPPNTGGYAVLLRNPAYLMYEGNRYSTMLKLASQCRNHRLSEDDFAHLTAANQVSSRDIESWSPDVLKAKCSEVWEYTARTHRDLPGFTSSKYQGIVLSPSIQRLARHPMVTNRIVNALGTIRPTARGRHHQESGRVLIHLLDRVVYMAKQHPGKALFFPPSFQYRVKAMTETHQDIRRLISVILNHSGLFKPVSSGPVIYRYGAMPLCREYHLMCSAHYQDIQKSIEKALRVLLKDVGVTTPCLSGGLSPIRGEDISKWCGVSSTNPPPIHARGHPPGGL